jgi:sterol desaturase/sphingolipid hydroxylase (fatty acid hydroxylase superfamily)
MIEQVWQLWVTEWAGSFLNPQKRIFWGYLLASLVIGIFWLRWVKKVNFISSLKLIINRKVWLSASAKADYKIMLINSFLMIVLSPRLLTKATVAYLIFNGIHYLYDGKPYILITPPKWVIAFSFTLVLFILDDFARYWLHRSLHKIPILWEFHKIHHSATSLNPFTIFRTHPVEGILFSLRSAAVQGFTTAVFFFCFGNQVSLLMVLGASIFNFSFNLMGSNLRHSPIAVCYWKPIEYMIMSPSQHHIHHSKAKEHRNKNFGVALSVWDWIFGSLCLSENVGKLNFGVGENPSLETHKLKNIYLTPFTESLKLLMIYISRVQEIFTVKKLQNNIERSN